MDLNSIWLQEGQEVRMWCIIRDKKTRREKKFKTHSNQVILGIKLEAACLFNTQKDLLNYEGLPRRVKFSYLI